MSALQVLENTIRTEHHARAREMAKAVCSVVDELLASGESPTVIHAEVQALYDRYRSTGESVERDAMVEVLDWLEEEHPGEVG